MEMGEAIKKKNGFEFRADPSYDYNFGMEIRIFDNFNTIYLDQLLELLFLIADHMYASKIDIKTIDNPFNNEILNNTIVKIFKQGWNTSIDREYIEIINRNLNLNLNINPIGKLTMAFDIIDEIYQYFQGLYILDGRGHYSKYLIGKDDSSFCKRKLKLKKLPNINRKSWEASFENLYWNINHNEILQVKNNLSSFEIVGASFE